MSETKFADQPEPKSPADVNEQAQAKTDPVLAGLRTAKDRRAIRVTRADTIFDEALNAASEPLPPLVSDWRTLPAKIRGLKIEAHNLRETARLLRSPYDEAEKLIKGEIATAPKGAFPNEPAREAEAFNRINAMPGYAVMVAEEIAILAAVKRLEIEIEYVESILRDYRRDFDRETAKLKSAE